MARETAVTLEELLAGRERRAAKQKALLEAYPGVLVSFTVNYPGPVKCNHTALKIHLAGAEAIGGLFICDLVLYNEQVELATGPEGYWVVERPAGEVKQLAVRLEETHPLGRLFDIDVLGRDGRPLGRESLGLPGRTCLLCGGEPTLCRRQGKHSLKELTGRIGEMVASWDACQAPAGR